MRSMTGHGRGTGEAAGRRVSVELRAVNHRFLDVKLRGSLDARAEERVQAALRGHAERGAFTITIHEEGTAAPALRVDAEQARAVAAALESLRAQLGLAEPVSLALVVAQPGVIVAGESPATPEAATAALDAALEQALGELVAMRRREGQTLAADLQSRLARLEELSAQIVSLAAAAPEEQRRKLGERIARLLEKSGVEVDPSRLAAEVALIADRLDVTEELVRLKSHVAQARTLIASDAAVGRKLDFLVQELGREVNTIGSKAQNAAVAHLVVEAKAELEKIREQVQNVE